MIKPICYVKVRVPHYEKMGQLTTCELDIFIKHTIQELKHKGVVYLILEPGDVTRYDIIILTKGREIYLIFPTKNYNYTFDSTFTFYPSSLYFIENVHAQYLIADLLNQIFGWQAKFYDWEKNCAIRQEIAT